MYLEIPPPNYDFNIIESSINLFRPGTMVVETPAEKLAINQKMFQLSNGDIIKANLEANDIGNITKYCFEIGNLQGAKGNEQFKPYATSCGSHHYEAICKLLGDISSNMHL